MNLDVFYNIDSSTTSSDDQNGIDNSVCAKEEVHTAEAEANIQGNFYFLGLGFFAMIR